MLNNRKLEKENEEDPEDIRTGIKKKNTFVDNNYNKRYRIDRQVAELLTALNIGVVCMCDFNKKTIQ